jgi:hypothetical protein
MSASAHRARVARRGALVASLAAAALAGCFADPTEVVVVVDTDAKPLTEFGAIQFNFSSGEQAIGSATTLPATVGVRPQGFSKEFDVLVNLNVGADNLRPGNPMLGQSPLPFAARKASNVQFIDGEMRVLFIPIPRACACVDASGMPSTNCPHALDPECADLVDPNMAEFDEDNIPRLRPSANAP